MYFELLQLHPIVVNLSFYGTGALMDRASTEGGGLSYNPMFAAMKALGVVVTNIDKAPICLNALVLERPFATSQELSSSIRKHYRTQLIQQLYKLVGSFEFLGNPVGLVNNLGTGVQDFFYEPAQGMMKSPAEFAKGMQKGSLSLFKNSTYGVFNAASKITSSMSKSLVQLSGDSDYAQKRQESQSQRQKAGSSNLAQARQDALNEMSEGLMDLTSKATEAVRDTTKDGEVLKRLRPPRVNVGDGVLRLYDARSAYGCNAMRVIHSGSWKNDRYIGFCVLDANEAALVTDKNICVHKFSSHEVAWELPIVAVKEVQVDGSKVLVLPQDGIQPVNDAGAKTAVTPMTCTDSRYAEYLGDVIRRAVSVAGIEFMHRKSKTANSEYML
ncbi:hypothetical protein GUITHDRAFT_154054 [Guillardia theta CCMP2712]|uniref:Intermembrane lipid transfer protein VPS13-like C-terminal domain-containing protein n=1 Tax=Guillardia theta (strain CCMP2712) TaxID=905079 RepID=L1IXT3_GUITC|nr:hypothetical protein GUITHDRAFT_154054 [Guillardia theta CCMP2712]EKX40689.1 hypothetical protein GUITHDRAFT_154054 [Guillardia theta CCMP2712]|eukprot:XP_005827669.1 hypothetical protein GUITHDRAFT_154054 [Guillardia theta CCMP2712]